MMAAAFRELYLSTLVCLVTLYELLSRRYISSCRLKSRFLQCAAVAIADAVTWEHAPTAISRRGKR